MNINPDIVSIENPVGLDAVIQSLQDDLSTIPWLEKVFGRAWEFKEEEDGKVLKVPKVFIAKDPETGRGEYFNVLPNDTWQSQSFFAVRGPEKSDGSGGVFGRSGKTRQLSVIFWFNLNLIDPTKDYVFTEELKRDVEQVLSNNAHLKSIDSYYDERVEDVFDGYLSEGQLSRYTINDLKTQYLMHPYSGFRFDITVAYTTQC